MNKMLSNCISDINLQIQEVEWNVYKISLYGLTSRQLLIKLLKVKNKERVLKLTR